LGQVLELYDPEAGHRLSPVMGADPGVTVRAVRGLTLWLLGYPDRGRESLQEALAQAREIEQPSSSAFAHLWAGATYALLGRDEAAARMHSEALRLLGPAGVIYGVWAELLAGQASATGPEPRLKQGSAQTAEAASATQALSSGVGYASLLLVQANVYARAGQAEMGLASVDQALAWVERTGVRVMEAEVWRMRGELLLLAANRSWSMDDRQPASPLVSRLPSSGEAGACFHHALEIARGQEARWLELRTAVSLARLWRSEGRRDEARELLAGIYNWFAEGLDTVDLVEARALLDELE
jgi:predicted ATPase